MSLASQPRQGLPHVAVITMARNEGRMLPRWVAHYSREVGAENLVVIDDNSDDGSTDDLPCPVLRIPPLSKQPFEPARMTMLSRLSAALLEAYDAVMFTDADEFVMAHPDRHESLRHFVAARQTPDLGAIGVLGLNVVHHVGQEPPLDPTKPILGQRKLAKFLPLMCKPSMKFVAADWVAASHGIKTPYALDPDLYMFHMKFADRDHLQEVADHRLQMVEQLGRAKATNWRHGPDELVALLDEISRDVVLDDVRRFSPPLDKLPQIPREEDGIWRSRGARQVAAMRNRPMVRIPKAFIGRV
ncbi:glycosyltransferase family 2 protein [Nocardioides pacificus]